MKQLSWLKSLEHRLQKLDNHTARYVILSVSLSQFFIQMVEDIQLWNIEVTGNNEHSISSLQQSLITIKQMERPKEKEKNEKNDLLLREACEMSSQGTLYVGSKEKKEIF